MGVGLAPLLLRLAEIALESHKIVWFCGDHFGLFNDLLLIKEQKIRA
jgi:hypothetical protein